MAKKKFRISSALKNILGKELITDDFIAVFELVKNSFDAHASKVEIIFEDFDTDEPRLIIKDNGKGMDIVDLENKWLFVAYSAKKDGSEDFRDKIKSNRIFAGAKGIGRFSCDKLGKQLKLYSKKRPNSPFVVLSVEWSDFEEDSKVEFVNIPVSYSQSQSSPYKFSKGTVLEISGFREGWDREKLLKLKRSLEKLINPNQVGGNKKFEIHLSVPSEKKKDAQVPKEESWDVVNGQIENFLFENLGLKTTSINVATIGGGKNLKTRLTDRGVLIYEITERNPFSYDGTPLSGIEVNLFALNRSAKVTFTKYMGMRSTDYGSVLLYKNGFRIHPFGTIGDDSLEIDARKAQGYARFLGTRELIGRIDISGTNEFFQETSSRDGGFAKNAAYECLKEMFRENCLRRLERYAVDIVNYGDLEIDFSKKSTDGESKLKILELIKSLTQSANVVDLHYDPKVTGILGELSEKSLQGLLSNFERLGREANNRVLLNEAKKARVLLERLKKSRDEAEAKAGAEAERADQAEKKTETSEKRRLFAESIISMDHDRVIALHHEIGLLSGTTVKKIKRTILGVSRESLTKEQVISSLGKIEFNLQQIQTVSKFASRANFSVSATRVKIDLIQYVEEYIGSVCSNGLDFDLKIKVDNRLGLSLLKKCKPIELAIIIDNILSNASKARAEKMVVEVYKKDTYLLISFNDNGKGFDFSKYNVNEVFHKGISTTKGSGLGLHFIKQAVEAMNGKVLVSNINGGGSVTLRF